MPRLVRFTSHLAAALILAAVGGAAGARSAQAASLQAQPAQAPAPEMRESCPGLIAARERPIPAAFVRAALAPTEVRLTFIGHATFLIESPEGVRIATDYNDYVRPPVVPDIVTMNRAHSTHHTDRPDPAITHVLRGWSADGSPAVRDLTVRDVHIRNVPTNIRDWSGGTQRHGNSIFVFEVGSLCIAHLGHLHHTLTQQQLDDLGRVDVVLVPVDGSYTLDMEGMVEVLKALKAPVMIPMHYFSQVTLERFLTRAREHWPVEQQPTPSLVLSRASLPATPQIVVLPGR